MNKTLHFVAVLTLAVFVAGCGFHLRGRTPLPESVSVLAVVGKDQDLHAALVDALRVSGATVVDDAKQAKAVLELANEKYERRVRTIDTRGKATNYRLFFTADYALTRADGTALAKTRSITVARDLDFDADQILAKENEERDLREEMVEDVAAQILRQVNAAARRASESAPVPPAPTPAPSKGS
jgi:LPS-assembly lipoprotein